MLSKNSLSKLKTLLADELSLNLLDDELYHVAIAIARFVCGKELRLAEIKSTKNKKD